MVTWHHPFHLDILKSRARTNLEGNTNETRLWVEGAIIEGFCYGTDGSCGSNNTDKRCRLCAWGVSVVGLSHDGTWECLGTRSGFLEGPKQSVPRAELRGLIALLRYSAGEVHCSCDSLITIKAFKRRIHCRRIKARAPQADLWMEVAQALQTERKLFPEWAKSHVDRKSFID